MLIIILVLTAFTAALLAITLLQLRSGEGAVMARLDQLHGNDGSDETLSRRRRQVRSERLKKVHEARVKIVPSV